MLTSTRASHGKRYDMQKITILCIGKLKERFYLDAAAEYAKRLSRYCKLNIVELPEVRLPDRPSSKEIEAALMREAVSIRERIPTPSTVTALCIEGQMRTSEELAHWMAEQFNSGAGHLTFLIGGSHGLDAALKAESRITLSMSPMTFPHHLARIMLLEQLYRAYQIQTGTRYHK